MKCKWYLCEKEVLGKGVFCSRGCLNKASVTRKRQALKVKAVEYKGGKCVRCGYDKSIKALHFHHLDPTKKDFGVSNRGFTRSWEKLRIELDKCDLVCSNCHAEIHEIEYTELVGNSLELTGWNSRVRTTEYCEDCNKQLGYNSKKKTNKCRKCFLESSSKITEPFEVVIEMVKKSNINRVAKHFNVSFNSVKKFINK